MYWLSLCIYVSCMDSVEHMFLNSNILKSLRKCLYHLMPLHFCLFRKYAQGKLLNIVLINILIKTQTFREQILLWKSQVGSDARIDQLEGCSPESCLSWLRLHKGCPKHDQFTLEYNKSAKL